jgi:hypothetical protein
LLLVLASVVILGSDPAALITIFCLRFEILPTWRARSLYLYPPETGWPSYNLSHWVPFSSPPTTPRATVEVDFITAQNQNPPTQFIEYPIKNFKNCVQMLSVDIRLRAISEERQILIPHKLFAVTL